MAPLAELGAQVKYLDVAVAKQLPVALASLHGATVVYSIPPVTSLPPGQAIRAAVQAAYGAGAGCFVHFSSAGLYGDSPDDETWIDEDTPVDQTDHAMANIRSDELALEQFGTDKLRWCILRLSPVYGPGRGIRSKLRAGTYKVLEDGRHATSRIHVDDVVRVVNAAETRAAAGSRYLVADDSPTTQAEYASWLCERAGFAPPPSRPIVEAGKPRVAHRNRKIRNARMKAELGVELRYPSFREGEVAIEAEEALE
jgi:nucleoside-diphosphate-sugar epimerase